MQKLAVGDYFRFFCKIRLLEDMQEKITEEFENKKALIVGEISTSKCIAEFKCVSDAEALPASAALVALYAASLKADVSLVGAIGPDVAGSKIIARLRDKKINLSGLTIDPLGQTPCWEGIHERKHSRPLNPVTEEQITQKTLEEAEKAQTILYISKDQANFSSKLYKELKNVSRRLQIPLTILTCLPLPEIPGDTSCNDLLITHKKKELKFDKALLSQARANQCLVIDKTKGFRLINRKENSNHHFKTNGAGLHQYEAALSALSILLLTCNKFPSSLPELAKNMSVKNNHISL